MNERWHAGLAVGVVGFLAASAFAGPPDYGIEFVRVGAPGNAAFDRVDWENWPNSPAVGRGRVDYEYRIGKFEITTSQYLEFANTFYGVLTENLPQFMHPFGPAFWGVIERPGYNGPGFQWDLIPNKPNAAMQPVFGLSWRDAAFYCNWLQNGKQSTVESILTGAYDVSTWGDVSGGQFTDAAHHLPGARFWIPTYDEQVKASHYDPNRYGEGQGGWWLSKNGSDQQGISGPPAEGTTSAGWEDPDVQAGEYDIPLGAYPDSLSPWGLLDTSGGTVEWNEEVLPRSWRPTARGFFGSGAGTIYGPGADSVYWAGGTGSDYSGLIFGLRIASAACRADFDRDGFVTGADFDLYVAAFEAGDMSADFDIDTFITGVDFDLFVQEFEAGC